MHDNAIEKKNGFQNEFYFLSLTCASAELSLDLAAKFCLISLHAYGQWFVSQLYRNKELYSAFLNTAYLIFFINSLLVIRIT
jgi:hypothetical protein